MKRFFSLALVLCMSLSLFTFNAQAQPTSASGPAFKGTPNTDLPLTAAEFEAKIPNKPKPLVSLNITALPDSADGELRLGMTVISTTTSIAWANLNNLVFRPKNDFRSTSSFKWTASDADGPSAEQTATLDFSVADPEALPQTLKVFINTPTNGQLMTKEKVTITPTYIKESEPAHGDAVISSKTGAFTYTPDPDFTGNDSFTFSVSHAYGKSNIATVTIFVSNATPPIANPHTFTVDYGKVVTGTLTGADTNNPKLDIDFIRTSDPTKGTITSFVKETGVFTYKHNTTGLVSDTFTFRTSNGYRESETATVTININPPAPSEYQDMTTHWAGFSAGILKTLNFAVGEKFHELYYYNPTKPVTRAEFARFLGSVMGISASKNTTSVFADVTEPYMIETVNALYENGITSGTQVGTKLYFYPDRILTRIEAMRMVDKAMKFATPGTAALTFADRNLIPSWGEQSVKNLVSYRIVTGNNGYLRPTDDITRAEVAQLMYLAYVEKKK